MSYVQEAGPSSSLAHKQNAFDHIPGSGTTLERKRIKRARRACFPVGISSVRRFGCHYLVTDVIDSAARGSGNAVALSRAHVLIASKMNWSVNGRREMGDHRGRGSTRKISSL